MSVLIKGFEMPKDCPYCPLAHWNFKNEFTGCEIVKKYFSTEELYADGRPEFCPLIEIKPHGRLIDADAMIEKYNSLPHRYDRGMVGMISNCDLFDALVYDLQKEPTIIEAEVENNGL